MASLSTPNFFCMSPHTKRHKNRRRSRGRKRPLCSASVIYLLTFIHTYTQAPYYTHFITHTGVYRYMNKYTQTVQRAHLYTYTTYAHIWVVAVPIFHSIFTTIFRVIWSIWFWNIRTELFMNLWRTRIFRWKTDWNDIANTVVYFASSFCSVNHFVVWWVCFIWTWSVTNKSHQYWCKSELVLCTVFHKYGRRNLRSRYILHGFSALLPRSLDARVV